MVVLSLYRFELITEGEPAELLVISNSPSFETFRVSELVQCVLNNLPVTGRLLRTLGSASRTEKQATQMQACSTVSCVETHWPQALQWI